MGRLEVSCHRFAVLSGIRQDANDYSICVSPRSVLLQKRGTLALITEPTGYHPALAVDVCRLARDVIIRQYYADTSLSLTGSLLNALDSANSALLEYNHGGHGHAPGLSGGVGRGAGSATSVAVRSSSVRTRRSMVGLTVVLLRADGTGVYLAQAAPTQAYIVHNGMLSAIPESLDRRFPHVPTGGSLLTQRAAGRNGGAGALTWGEGVSTQEAEEAAKEATEAETEAEAEAEGAGAGTETEAYLGPEAVMPGFAATEAGVLAPPLGSGPGVEADLIYRRVGPGDLIVLVSTSLARNLDRVTAEAIMLSDDAHAVAENLFELACSLGLAEAHACVLQLGVDAPSGVETEPDLSAGMTYGLRSSTGNGTSNDHAGADRQGHSADSLNGKADSDAHREGSAAHPHPERDRPVQRLSGLLSLLKGGRQDSTVEVEPSAPAPVPDEPDDDFPDIELPHHPTQALLVHSLEVPPVHIRMGRAPVEPEQAAGHGEEPEFDGWEDLPPALRKRLLKPREPVSGAEAAEGDHRHDRPASDGPSAVRSVVPRVPALFDPASVEVEAEEEAGAGGEYLSEDYETQSQADAVREEGEESGRGRWAWFAGRAFTPPAGVGRSRALAAARRVRAVVQTGVPATLPVRLIIGLAMLVVGALLVVSVLNISAGQKQSAVEALLRQAQQEDVAANAPNIGPAEKQQHLTQALQKARQALATDPRSAEAQRMVSRLQLQLDRAQGITRLGSPRLLFDLDQADRSPTGRQQGTTQTPAGQATPAPTSSVATSPVTASTAYIGGILIQGNDAYVLDKQENRVYRCSISTQNCTLILSAGDSAGGQSVGPLVGMALAVGRLVALDKTLTAYLFDADTSAWQVQPLGDADKLDLPYDVDSYDGNLYLLGAKPAQISKYFAGRYGEPPQDWITEPAALEQVKNPVSMAIDGHIYLLLRDGTVLVMQGGKVTKTMSIATDAAVAGEPTALFTGTDTRDLYVLASASGTITRLSKEGQRLAVYKAPADNQTLAVIDAMTVDEGHNTVYLARGRQIYQARLTGGADMPDQVEP